MDWLKEILGDLATDEVIEKFKKEFPKHAVPKEQYAKKVSELDATATQLEQQNAKLQEIESKVGDVEATKKLLSDTKTEYDQFKADADKRIATTEKKAKLEVELHKSFIEDSVSLIIDKLNFDEIELKDGNVRDLNEHIEKLKTQYPKLAKTTTVDGDKPPTGGTNPPQADTSKLSDAEYYATKGIKPLWGK